MNESESAPTKTLFFSPAIGSTRFLVDGLKWALFCVIRIIHKKRKIIWMKWKNVGVNNWPVQIIPRNIISSHSHYSHFAFFISLNFEGRINGTHNNKKTEMRKNFWFCIQVHIHTFQFGCMFLLSLILSLSLSRFSNAIVGCISNTSNEWHHHKANCTVK